MERQKTQARAAGKFKMERALEYTGGASRFTGYEDLAGTAKITAIYAAGTSVAALKTGQHGVLVLDRTPFYAESGGQVGDQGLISSGSARFAVDDTLKIKADVHGHHGWLEDGTLNVGDTVQARVNTALRAATMRNHSATHLMHQALRAVLGSHVQQKGSRVNAERTRFDFAHNAGVSSAELREIERRVNEEILANQPTQARVMDIEAARSSGAMMLFDEKYGAAVRVLDIGSSRELCAGTHVQRTGDIGLFKGVAEGGVAAGVRRIEAVTGSHALAWLQQLEDTVNQAAGTLRAPVAELNGRISQALDNARALEKEVAALKSRLAASQGQELLARAVQIKGLAVLAATLPGADAKTLRATMDQLKDKLKTAAIVLAAVDGDKVQLAAGVTADSVGRIQAGVWVTFVAGRVGGKGAGKPDMAMAGGTDAAGLPAALASVAGWVSGRLWSAQGIPFPNRSRRRRRSADSANARQATPTKCTADSAMESEQLDIVIGHLGGQMAAGHQVVVEADLVAAMLLGVVQGLVGLAQDFHWRPPGRADKAQAHGDLADLRERVLLHRHAETVEHLVGRAQRGRAQQHHELLAAEAEHAVVAAERVAQDVGNQDQHLIAIQMAEAVVDLLEVVDVDHGQPLLHGFAGQHMRVAGEHRRGRIRAADQAMQRVARELLIEGLAVEQAGERVAFAVVEQALVVLVDLKHALEDIELVCRKGARLRDLQAGADLVVHPHRQP